MVRQPTLWPTNFKQWARNLLLYAGIALVTLPIAAAIKTGGFEKSYTVVEYVLLWVWMFVLLSMMFTIMSAWMERDERRRQRNMEAEERWRKERIAQAVQRRQQHINAGN